MSSKLGKQISDLDTKSRMIVRALERDQSFKRRFVSKLIKAPFDFANSRAELALSQADGEIATEMPERCSTRVVVILRVGNALGVIRLAADHFLKKLNSCPLGPCVTK